MKMLRTFLPAILLLTSAACALCQEAPKSPEERFAEYAKGVEDKTLADPSLSSVARLPKLQAKVAATRTDTTAEIEVGLNSVKGTNSEFQAGFKVSGPISKSASETKLATLNGLTDQAKVSVSLHWMYPRPETRFFNANVFRDALIKQARIEHPGKDASSGVVLDELSSAGQTQVLADIGLGKGIWLFGAEGTYSAPQTFNFVIPETLGSAHERHDGYSVAASFGWLPLRPTGQYYIGATYTRVQKFEAPDSQQICVPFGVGAALTCSDVVVGGPEKKVKNVGQLETRMYFYGGQLAINPRLSHDFAKGITGVELPIYFLKDATGVLNGGLALGWRSDTREYTVSAFVGSMANPFKK